MKLFKLLEKNEFCYRVKENDNIYNLSRKLNFPIFEIIAQNNLKGELYNGQLLYLKRENCPLVFLSLTNFLTLNKMQLEKIKRENHLTYIPLFCLVKCKNNQ